MTGEAEYDPEFYNAFVKILKEIDPRLLESVNAQWKGFKDYAASGGNPPEDVWETCPDGYQVQKVFGHLSNIHENIIFKMIQFGNKIHMNFNVSSGLN